ncbi:MAG: pilus assembly PilX N-terminal domain-containing protein [Gemmatimonadota bacterium]
MKRMRRFARPRRLAPGLRAESGIALFGVIVLAVVMMILVLSVLMIGTLDAGLAKQRAAKSSAFYLAEGGLACGLAWLEAQGDPPDGGETILPFGATPDTLGHGTYTVSIIPDSTNSWLDKPRYTILSTGHVAGQARILEQQVRSESITDFLYFTDREHEPGQGNPLWFHSGDLIDGPLFTNDQISIMGDPTFAYTVTSAYGGPGDPHPNHEPGFLYYNGDQHNNIESTAGSNPPHDNPDFQAEYDLSGRYVDYPSHQITNDIKQIAQGGGVSVAGHYEISFSRPHDDTGEPMYGYVSYRRPGVGGKAAEWTDVEISSTNGLLYVNGSFEVHGVLDGTMTLATNGSVWITDDLVYRDSDENGPGTYCDDMLGIIAGTDINVEDTAANLDDCEIHASMISLANSFRASQWNTGDPRGDLTVYGSVAQGFRGSVGTSELVGDEEVILTGYAKDYHYDWRLFDQGPPHFYEFFGTGNYVRVRWRELDTG